MTVSSPETSRWQAYAELPFFRLVRLFTGRVFHGGGEPEAEELNLGLGAALALLALPGSFISLLLFDKYGSLLRLMRGQTNFDVYAAAVPDEYFFIVFSMVVTAAIVTWRWDSIFPDRRDYANLVPLPLPMRQIFLANLTAVLLLTAVFAVDLNAGSAVLFPIVVSASQETFLFFGQFALVHALTIILASVFSCLAVFAIVGVLLSVLPYMAFRRISLYVRGLILTFLLATLSTSFAVPGALRGAGKSAGLIRCLPSVWFLGLFQWLRGRASPAEIHAAKLALAGLGAALALALIGYAVSYRRCFIKIPETVDITTRNARRLPRVGALFDRVVLRDSPERACYHFVLSTLLRSERHSIVVAAFAGLGVVVASEMLVTAFTRGFNRGGTPSAEVLSVPLILCYCLLVGLRLVFQMPAELRANWIFRLLLDPGKPPGRTVARKIMLSFVLPIAGIALPVYVAYWGWLVGFLHSGIVIVWSWLLIETLLLYFRKIPFTCSYPSFEHNAIVSVLIYLLGFYAFALLTAKAEAEALAFPAVGILLLPAPMVGWWILRGLRRDTPEIDQQLMFEEHPTTGFELLSLNE
ncbi:MAG TPA: hypothetical protein VE083_00700 [Terriglobales bacterium]|nr:hypothetical protein [Terriglobales bacterium]